MRGAAAIERNTGEHVDLSGVKKAPDGTRSSDQIESVDPSETPEGRPRPPDTDWGD